MNKKTVKDVLEEYIMSTDEAEHTDIHQLKIGDVSLMINNRLEKLTQAIKQLMLDKLPDFDRALNPEGIAYAEGYNECLRNIKKIIEEL